MKIFSVHHKAIDPAIILSEGLETRFVKEGISWTALFITPLWLVFHRLWLVLAAVILLYVMIGAGAEAYNLHPNLSLGLVLVINVLIALEGNSLRRWKLQRSGHKEIGVVTGQSLEHCERRFFESLLDPYKKLTQRHDIKTPSVKSALAAMRPTMQENDSVVGLFPEPDPKL